MAKKPFPLRCKDQACGKVVMIVFKNKTIQPYGEGRIVGLRKGDILAECGTCLGVSVWEAERKYRPFTDPGLPLPPMVAPRDDEIVRLMEERWALFSKEKLRERGRVASGLRFDVFMRDDFRCRYCGRSIDDGIILHADHVVPESKGGPTTLANLVTSCIDCNLGKSDKGLEVVTAAS